MAKVETQAIGRIQRAALCDVIAKRIAQRLVEEVGHRVVRLDRIAAGWINDQFRALPLFDLAFGHLGHVDKNACNLFGVRDFGLASFGAQDACVANLTTRFSVERRLVEDDLNLTCGLGRGADLWAFVAVCDVWRDAEPTPVQLHHRHFAGADLVGVSPRPRFACVAGRGVLYYSYRKPWQNAPGRELTAHV